MAINSQVPTVGATGYLRGSFVQLAGISPSTDGSFDPNAKVWTHSEGDIRALTQSGHRNQVDGPLIGVAKAVERLDVNSSIVCPSVIYGAGFGPVRRDLAFFRKVINVNEYSSLVGKRFMSGKEVTFVLCPTAFKQVRIADIVDLFNRVYKMAVEAVYGPPLPNPYQRYYIASVASVPWKEMAHCFARGSHKEGILESFEAESVAFGSEGQLVA